MILGWVWLALILAAVLAEVLFHKSFFVAFIPGAVIGLLLDLFEISRFVQIASVAGLMIACVIFSLVFGKRNRKNGLSGNIENVVGEKCVVVEQIDNFAGCGEVCVNGQVWSARGVDEDDVFEEGEVLNIVAIEGVKLICRK